MVHEHTYCECGESYKSNHRLTGGKQGCSTGSCTSMAVDLPKKVFQASGHPKPDQDSNTVLQLMKKLNQEAQRMMEKLDKGFAGPSEQHKGDGSKRE